MAWKYFERLSSTNRSLSNVYSGHGAVENISDYLFSENGMLQNFIISGGNDPMERYAPLYPFLEKIVGRVPVIVFHARDNTMEKLVCDCCGTIVESDGIGTGLPVCLINQANRNFEPFYGMSDMQVITVCRQLAVRLGYTPSPGFERVVRAHIEILKHLDIPVSLSGFYYLCQFYDMGEFYDNIMALPCDQNIAKRIWADLGIEDTSGSSQFELFRAVINNLAQDAEQSGWNPDNSVAEMNCITAIDNNFVLLMSINNMYGDLLLTYITAELKAARRQDFMLLIDGVHIRNDCIVEYILARRRGSCFGIVAENVIDLIDGDENVFFRIAEKAECFILFKHGTGKTAAFFSEVIGRFDAVKSSTSSGANYGMMGFFPNTYHQSVENSTENRYRVMPEEITSLCQGQAIIFDTVTDRIIKYN